MDDKEFKFEVTKQVGVLGEGSKGWRKELNLVSWNGREAKLDIREWSPDHLKMGKGVTMSKEEAVKLIELLKDYLST
ncbi:MAG: PC4/YdbC family ssDNA-binding protein [Treponema sp.]|nr:PC4/YdbC family ssDNA-binding protein [Treponema sp.]